MYLHAIEHTNVLHTLRLDMWRKDLQLAAQGTGAGAFLRRLWTLVLQSPQQLAITQSCQTNGCRPAGGKGHLVNEG